MFVEEPSETVEPFLGQPLFIASLDIHVHNYFMMNHVFILAQVYICFVVT